VTELFRLGLRDAVAGVRDGRFSSEAYTRSLLDRIAALEPTVQAFAWLDPGAALDHARRCDEARPRDDGSDCLRGIPLAVKDVIDTAGIPTECGTPVYRGRVPVASAAVVRKLEEVGGFLLGKTVTAELGFYTPGVTCNPWNPAHTPGGSSSGSAAAVAAGFAPVALGTQTNGSVIRPAAFCGVVGFKPSSGMISRAGVLLFSQTLDHVGVFARSVDDAARLTCCIAGFDAGDAAGVNAPHVLCSPSQTLPELEAPPRLAVVRTPVWFEAEAHQRENLLDMASRFGGADAVVEEVALPPIFEGAHRLHHTIMFGEGARALHPLQAKHRAQLSDRVNALIDEGLAIPDAEIEEAMAQRLQLNREMRGILGNFDAIITPPATGEAPATLTHTGDPTFCSIWTLTGLPAVTLPSGFGPNGLPLGVQIVGSYMRDDRLMAVAKWCEQVIGLGPLIAPGGVSE
jgi:Asp-tRNA(Asn)/Glu-tRNA(Gln) amidotransferase A subunit family amidase